MKLRTRNQINPNFSLSSMTDIVFLLLIFFMLTVSPMAPQALSVDLPTSNHAEASPAQVNVTITAALEYYVDGAATPQEEVPALLRQKLSNNDTSLVLLQIDQKVPVAHMIYVTDLAAALNAKVAVATKPDANHGKP